MTITPINLDDLLEKLDTAPAIALSPLESSEHGHLAEQIEQNNRDLRADLDRLKSSTLAEPGARLDLTQPTGGGVRWPWVATAIAGVVVGLSAGYVLWGV